MPISISISHPIFALREKVQEIAGPFLNAHGFNYFQFLRCYADGSIGLLTNNTGLMEFAQQVEKQPVVFSSFENEQSHEYWFLWDEKLPKFPVNVAREKYNIRQGITWVRRTKYYYDMIAFAMPQEKLHINSFYMNKLKLMEKFVIEFEKNNIDLIDIMTKNSLVLPNDYRDINYQKICLPDGRIYCVGRHGDTYITSREMACFQLLSKGSSYKEAAQMLDISPRTVETYIKRVKERSGYVSFSDIEQMIVR